MKKSDKVKEEIKQEDDVEWAEAIDEETNDDDDTEDAGDGDW
jgi:hypothetical protein